MAPLGSPARARRIHSQALSTAELTAADEPRLQRFFEANPAYSLAVLGSRRVMVKPLVAQDIRHYLDLVPRDRPEPAAPP